MLTRFRTQLLYFAYLGLATLAILTVVEGALRIAGLPHGLFQFQPVDRSTLYLPSTKMHLVWDLFPYTIETNRLGFRGPEIDEAKPAGTTRILALGDSVTIGFYVNDEDTYPRQVEARLRLQGHDVEVINAGLGDTSIDMQRAIYLEHGAKLQPDTVLLTFVANDIDGLRGKSRPEILSTEDRFGNAFDQSEWLLFGRTAIGELILDQATQWRVKKYREHRQQLESGVIDGTPTLEGGEDFSANVQIFLEEHARPADGIALYEEYSPVQEALVADYLFALDNLHEHLRENGTELLFVYFPDYPEVYDSNRKVPLNNILREACAERGIPFLDLVPAFRAAGEAVLHFAPVDFHPNARGNAVMAKAVATWIANRYLPDAP